MNRTSQKGIALIITLIMLSIVTFMAVTFLALSRRERVSVTVSSEQTTARLMAEAAFARASADTAARLKSLSSAFNYDFTASTNFFSVQGFQPGLISPTNVNYNYRTDGQSLAELDRIINIANLMFNPRAPVYVTTNNYFPLNLDSRFYLDLNRNGKFETNGLLPVLDIYGNPMLVSGQILSNYFVGDPEWIGILENPEFPHSATNRFIGRYAFLILPQGKSLDFNFIHNQAKRPALNADGFFRNHGFASWEINMAAFLRDLNTNLWTYRYNISAASSFGTAFSDALDLLRFRYNNDYNNLSSIANLYGPAAAVAFVNDDIDGYADGPLITSRRMALIDTDNPDNPWPGSDNPRLLSDAQELFIRTNSFYPLTQKLLTAGTNRSSYDRYTFYRLLSQAGVDSASTLNDALNINYHNSFLIGVTNFIDWAPAEFFNAAAERLLRTHFNFGVTNIPVFPTNYYSAAVHRLLQVAANIFDATTNRTVSTYPCLPSVFRPMFKNSSTNIFIAGYEEITNTAFLNRPWRDLANPADRLLLTTNDNVFGFPLVIGAKKGFPNFNEFSLQTAIQASRKLEVRKPNQFTRPGETNQMFIMGISNVFGVEAWNSYTQAFPRPLSLRVTNYFTLFLTNETAAFSWSGAVSTFTNIMSPWPGRQFLIPIHTNVVFLTNAAYLAQTPSFVSFHTNYSFERGMGYPVPQWGLILSNSLQYVAIDLPSQRVVDFVNLTNMTTYINITRELVGNQVFTGSSTEGAFWRTNRLGNNLSSPTEGALNQINTSLGQGALTNNVIWQNYSQDALTGLSKDYAIDRFRVFVGLNPIKFTQQQYQMQQELGNSITHQAPFSPTRKIYQTVSWQVNDPFVHYTFEDLIDLEKTNVVQYAIPPQSAPTNSNLGQLNQRYRPWGGNPNVSSDPNAFNITLKDPLVWQSDDWDFPTNKFPNIGWLGRVHRGTPWQTIYLKAPLAETNTWQLWAVNPFTNPTNDWLFVEEFTVAPNDNAARGLLSVNQTNVASWSSVLSGMTVLSNSIPRPFPPDPLDEYVIEPNSPQLLKIVDNVNLTRTSRPAKIFRRLGEVLAAPALNTESPFLTPYANPREINISDSVYEWIPQHVLSLLKIDKPRVVIYAFGQSLAPAERSLVLAPGQPYHRMCTNYQITSEAAMKHVIRFDVSPASTNVIQVNAVQERFQFLSNE